MRSRIIGKSRSIKQCTLVNQSTSHQCISSRHIHSCLFSHRLTYQSNSQSINHSINQSVSHQNQKVTNNSACRSFSTVLHYDPTKQRSSVLDPSIVNPSTNQSIIQSITPSLSQQKGRQNDQSLHSGSNQTSQQPSQQSHNQSNQQSNQQTINQSIHQPNSQLVRQFPVCPPQLNPANLPSEPAIIAPLSFYRARTLMQANTQSINEQALHPTINSSVNQPIKRVLIYKKVTTLEEIRRGIKNPVDFPYLRADAKVLLADREHSHTLSTVRQSLTVLGLEWREVETISQADLVWCDVLMCVGGDGTFLKAQRAVSETVNRPMVGVNSAPSSSFGFFCAADHASISTLLSRLIDGSALVAPLWRMRVCVNGVPIGPLILNEMLFCNPIPSGTTRYWLTDGGVSQQQQSSGCWISTAAGSTGAIHGAGGELMNLSDSRFQYRIRELFSLPLTHPRDLPVDDEFPHLSFRPRASIERTVLSAGYCQSDFSLQSRMMSGCLYFDGSVTAYPVSFNDTVTLQRSAQPLQWVAPTLKNDGKTVADHWELVTGLQRAKLPPKQAQAQREQAIKYGFEQYNP